MQLPPVMPRPLPLRGKYSLLFCCPFDAHCCHMGTASIKRPVPDRVKPSFVIFDIRALWRVPIWQQWASKG